MPHHTPALVPTLHDVQTVSDGCVIACRRQRFFPRRICSLVNGLWQAEQTARPLVRSCVPPSMSGMMWSASVAILVQFGPSIWQRRLARARTRREKSCCARPFARRRGLPRGVMCGVPPGWMSQGLCRGIADWQFRPGTFPHGVPRGSHCQGLHSDHYAWVRRHRLPGSPAG